MSAREFALHQAYMRRVPVGWEGLSQLWARLMAATANGPMSRRDKAQWTAQHFAADPWAPPPPAKATGIAGLRAFVAGLRRK